MSLEPNNYNKIDEVDIKELWWLIKKNYILLTLIIVTSISIAGIYILVKKPVYESSAMLYVDKNSGEDWWDMLGGTGANDKGHSDVYIIKSRTIAEKVVNNLHLTNRIINKSKSLSLKIKKMHFNDNEIKDVKLTVIDNKGNITISGIKKNFLIKTTFNTPVSNSSYYILILSDKYKKNDTATIKLYSQKEIVHKIRLNTSADFVEKKSKIINITYRDINPKIAAEIVNNIAENFIKWNIDLRSEAATKTKEFIDNQLNIVRENLTSIEKNLGDFKKEKGVIILSKEIENYVEQISKIKTKKFEMEFQLRAFEEFQKAIRNNQQHIPLFTFGDDQVLTNMVNQIIKLRSSIAVSQEEYTNQSQELSLLQNQLKQNTTALTNYVKSKISEIKIQIRELNNVFNLLMKKISSLPDAERKMASLERKLNVSGKIYQFLLEKREEAQISKAMTVSNIRIIDPAIPSDFPIEPKKKLIFFFALLFGTFGGILFIIILEYFKDSIKSLEELKHTVNLPIFGIIPKIYAKLGKDNGDIHEKMDPYLIMKHNPKSPVSEAYRTLRTNISFISPSIKHKTFLITSGAPQEGKSITLANLAITISELGGKTLIIDFDLRRPRQNEIFNKSQQPGITDIITKNLSTNEVIIPLSINNLFLLPSGTIPPNPAELISTEKCKNMIMELKKEFDYILIDTPPVTVVTDAMILSELVDAVFLVVVEGSSKREVIKAAVEQLSQKSIGKLEGIIFNNVVMGIGNYGYSYNNYYNKDEITKKSFFDYFKK